MKRLALLAGLLLLATPAYAATYYVDWNSGADPPACIPITAPTCGDAPGASACKTINCLIGEKTLVGGDHVKVKPGIYRPQLTDVSVLTIGGGDAGSSDGSRVTIEVDGPGVATLSGLDLPALNDTAWAACSAGDDCDGNSSSDLSSTRVFWQAIGSRAVGLAYEVNMSLFSVQCRVANLDNVNVDLPLDSPIPYANCNNSKVNDDFGSTWACVSQAAGSFAVVNGKLLVHTWVDDTDVAVVRASRDIETAHVNTVVTLGAQWVTFDGFEVAYGGGGAAVVQVPASNVTLSNGNYHSNHGNIVHAQTPNQTNLDFINVRVHDSQRRENWTLGGPSNACTYPFSTSGHLEECGWCDGSNSQQGSYCVALGNQPEGASNFRLEGLDVYNCWNALSFDNIGNSVIINSKFHNAPNHGLYAANKMPPNSHCDNNKLIRVRAWNTQDSDNAGCSNEYLVRSFLPGHSYYGGQSSTPPVVNARIYGNLFAQGIKFNFTTARASTGALSNRNWLNNDNTNQHCKDGDDGGGDLQCIAGWGTGAFDANSIFGTTGNTLVDLAGFATWPPTSTQGAAAAAWTDADFVPLVTSNLIDAIPANSIDVDGDGVNDPCDAAHHCFGSGFDIGPFEYGIDSAAGPPDTTAPAAITNLSVTGSSSSSCSLQWTTTYDDGNVSSSGSPATLDIRRVTGATTAIDSDGEYNAATTITGEPSPIGGAVQTMTVTSLSASTTYSFNIKASDSTPNTSVLGQPVSCTTTAATAGGHIDCTEAAFEAALLACPASVTFNCAPGTVITVKAGKCSGGAQGTCYLDTDCTGASSGTCNRGYREIASSCTGMVVDGENKVEFRPDVAWYQRSICAGACDTNSDGTPENCPATDDTGQFLIVRGDGNTLKNFSLRNFPGGINFDGTSSTSGVSNNIVENVDVFVAGDDAFTFEPGTGSAGPNIIRGTVGDHLLVQDFCDKGTQTAGIATDVAGNTGFNWTVGPYVDFLNGVQPIRSTQDGRGKIDRTTIASVNPPTIFDCDMSVRFDTATKAYVEWVDSTVTGCKYALRLGGGFHLWAHGNSVFTANRVGGISVYENARLVMDDADLLGNGGTFTSGTPTGYGGVSREDSALVEIGTDGSGIALNFTFSAPTGTVRESIGGNLFTNNTCNGIAGACNVYDNGSGSLKAAGNCWNDADPTDEVKGTNAANVTTSPFAAACTPIEPPPEPSTQPHRGRIKKRRS